MLQKHIRNPSANIWKRGISEKCLQMRNNKEVVFASFCDREAPKVTTNMRIVFHGSAKCDVVSLNDAIHQGQNYNVNCLMF